MGYAVLFQGVAASICVLRAILASFKLCVASGRELWRGLGVVAKAQALMAQGSASSAPVDFLVEAALAHRAAALAWEALAERERGRGKAAPAKKERSSGPC